MEAGRKANPEECFQWPLKVYSELLKNEQKEEWNYFGQGGIQMCWVRSRKSRCFTSWDPTQELEPCRSFTVQSFQSK